MADSTTQVTVSLGEIIDMDGRIRKLEAENKNLKYEIEVLEKVISQQKEPCICRNRNCVDCYTDDLAELNLGIEVDDD